MPIRYVGVEKVSVVDYDGKIACTIFVNNCNFRCPFCHNAPLVLNETGDYYEISEILDYLESRKKIIEAVCVTGGEPTLKLDLAADLRAFKKLGMLVKLDTNGSNPEVIKSLVKEGLLDYIAMDIKNDEEGYNQTTSSKVDFSKIKESIAFIKNSGVDYEFRTTLVAEFHDFKNIENICHLIKGAKRYYLQHFVSGNNCLNPNLHEVSKEKALEYQKILKEETKTVELRGY